jgi:hypothetical protein
VGPEIGADTFEGALHAGDHVLGVQAVHQQQAGHQIIVGEASQDHVVEVVLLIEDLHHPLQAGPVQVDDEAHQLLGPLPHHDATGRRGVEQALDALTGVPKVGTRLLVLLGRAGVHGHARSPVTPRLTVTPASQS